jgi:hypothetical protein
MDGAGTHKEGVGDVVNAEAVNELMTDNGWTHLSALCISSSVADMKSVLLISHSQI